jgi:hypothetical protein
MFLREMGRKIGRSVSPDNGRKIEPVFFTVTPHIKKMWTNTPANLKLFIERGQNIGMVDMI